ncbi:leucyl/phenylalanyl-tRNA--protein transferase [Desulfatiferula olefinivorans]
MPVFRLTSRIEFPPAYLARHDGLLAVGGDLSPQRLILAYSMGIFPWYNWDEPILWWSPDPRLVLFPPEIRISRSLSKLMRKAPFRISFDEAFDRVIRACAQVRLDQEEGTWINERMIEAYGRLHEEGLAHSVEAWIGDRLVGGLYGVALGRSFFGESMFSLADNASKVALAALNHSLREREFVMIDCQVKTGHLMRFGARNIDRDDFLAHLNHALSFPTLKGRWLRDDRGGLQVL